MSYQTSRNEFLSESEYVDQVAKAVSFIRSTSDEQALRRKGQELNRIIQSALAARTASRDLITMEQLLAQGVALSDIADQRNGGRDWLLQQRKAILQNAYEHLDASF